jgi:antirestriction protein ArdC
LTRIESEAFYQPSLQSIVIPRNVQFIDGSAFLGVNLSSISIESGNEIFVLEYDILIDVINRKLMICFQILELSQCNLPNMKHRKPTSEFAGNTIALPDRFCP